MRIAVAEGAGRAERRARAGGRPQTQIAARGRRAELWGGKTGPWGMGSAGRRAPEGGGLADDYARTGEELQDMGRTEEAMAHFGRAVKADPRHTVGLFKMAEVLLALNRVDEAGKWCKRAIESNPGDARPHHVMGLVHSRMRRTEASAAEFAEAARLDPSSFRSHANLGAAHAEAGRPKEALRCFDSALKIDPKYAYAHYERSIVLGTLGRDDEARRSLERAIECDPRYMLGDARVHLRADRQAELNRAGWREGKPPKGLGRIRLPKGRRKARSEEGRERDLTLARFEAACELEGISASDALDAMLSVGSEPEGGASIVDKVREMRAGGKEGAGPRVRRVQLTGSKKRPKRG